MLDNVTVDLAPLLNWIIYITLFLITNFLLRRLIRITYGRRIVRICKDEVLQVFSEHYREHGFKNNETLKVKIYSLNKELKDRFGLNYSPFYWYDLDSGYYEYDDISNSFGVEYIHIYKRMWFYKMKFKKFYKYGDRIHYKDCMKENRENKIDNLLD